MFSKVTANLAGAKKRYETFNGKQWLVVPTVMLDEGVWTGSEGSLFYGKPQLIKNPLSWNHKPVIINHPKDGDTACTPAILEAQQVGIMLNTRWDDPLKTEFWCDDETKLMQLAPSVATAIANGQNVEVSTGLHHDLDDKPGTWNGKQYKASVINIQPDHLAILPDTVGAYSIADGGGLLRNASGDLSFSEVKDCLHMDKNGAVEPYNATVPYDRRIWIVDVYPKHVVYEQNSRLWEQDYKIKDGKAVFTGEPSEVTRKITYVTANGSMKILGLPAVTNTVPASCFTINSEGKLTMAKTYTDGEKQALVTKGAQLLTNAYKIDPQIAQQVVQNAIMQGVAELVEASTKHLDPGVPAAVAAGADTQPPAVIPASGDRSNVHGPGGGNIGLLNPLNPGVPAAVAAGASTQPPAVIPASGDRSNVHNEAEWERAWLAGAPPRIRNAALSQLQRDEQERTQLVQALATNQRVPFSQEYLATLPTPHLRGMVAMIQNATPPPPAHDFAGQGGPPMFRTPAAPTGNAAQQNEQQFMLPFPTMGFDEPETKAV